MCVSIPPLWLWPLGRWATLARPVTRQGGSREHPAPACAVFSATVSPCVLDTLAR